MLFANVCAGFISSCFGELWDWHFFVFWASLWCLVHMGSASFASLSVVYKAWVTSVCLLLDTPFGRRSVEVLPFVTSAKTAWQLIKLPTSILGFRLNYGCGSHICLPQWDGPVSTVLMHL